MRRLDRRSLLETCLLPLQLQEPAEQALWGVLCLAFFIVLRRSEIVATTSTTFRWFALKAADVSAIDAAGVPTSVPRSAAAVSTDPNQTRRASQPHAC